MMYFCVYLLCILSLTTTSSGLKSMNCTVSCNCHTTGLQNVTVVCRTGFWRRIPDVPEHTTDLTVRGSDMGVLQGPPRCVNYEALLKLTIAKNKITAISNTAFRCFNNLIALNIKQNQLSMLNPSAMIHLQKLQSLTMDHNQLTSRIINTLCHLKSITDIKLSHNKLILSEGTLECMSNLTNLHLILMTGNYFNGSFKDIIRPLQNVTTIDANSCKISYVEEDAFHGFSAKFISLQRNSFKEIQNRTFADLSHLRQLELGYNPLNGSHNWISSLTQIYNLDIRHIGLSGVPPLPKYIRDVNLSYNIIPTFRRHSFFDLPRLRKIFIAFAHIEVIEPNSLAKLPVLKYLYLQYNRLQGKDLTNLLSSLSNSTLQQLILDGNPIKSINKTIFDGFQPNVLRTLSLKNCHIEYIGTETFIHLRALEKLDLSLNKLHNLERNTFKGLHSLTVLVLKNNHLFDFKGELNGLRGSALKELDLARNDIESFTSGTLWELDNVNFLDLSRNHGITSVRRNLFHNMSSLSTLKMKDCGLTHIQDGAFSSLVNLTHLDLSQNSLTLEYQSASNFRNMTMLKTLHLSDNLIGSAGIQLQTIWVNLHNLTVLGLNNCKIPKLFPGMFSLLRHLKILYLNGNYISFIQPRAFKNTSELEELYLDNNGIDAVSWISFVNLLHLRKLSLQGNHFKCTCDILWIVQTIKSQHIYIPQQDNLRCIPPGQHKTRKLDIKVLDCEEPWVAILKPIGTALAGMSLLLIMYLIRHYQWRIRYIFFLAKAGIHRYREIQNEEQYEYDAFVAYHSDDLPWVEHTFLHHVDKEYLNEKGYSLCIHHRDWLVGEYITDNIRKSIVESRKTIIILSKAFATSHWCRFELEMARASTDGGRQGDSRLVVILLESIPEELLNPHLVHILTTKTYIAWPKDPALQPRFWKAVRKALKKELLYNI